MKAIQISAPGELGVVDINTPVPGEDEVLLKIKYVGFCGSDLNTFLGYGYRSFPDTKSGR